MDTYVIMENKGVYYLIPGTLTLQAKCSMRITNPEKIKKYAATYPDDYKYVLTDVKLSTGEFQAYNEVEILSFRINPFMSAPGVTYDD